MVQTQGTLLHGSLDFPNQSGRTWYGVYGPGIRHGVGATVDVRLESPCSRWYLRCSLELLGDSERCGVGERLTGRDAAANFDKTKLDNLCLARMSL
jgi:hypothetical protein